MTVQSGLTLIETLVALVVLSAGLLGVAALQVHGLSAGRSANYRSHAANLAADMAERIRSNPLGLDAYAGPGSDNRCTADVGEALECTPEQMATHDVFLWDRAIRSSLPVGDWRIEVDSGSVPPGFRIAVTWVEPRHGQVEYLLSIRAMQR